ncbi:MAG: YaaA family protein [Spirochaetales bacterium]|nr:YaaA family protein [Spirochaetales bacterium]
MQILFSPTKQMDFQSDLPSWSSRLSVTTPRFQDKAVQINSVLKKLGSPDLSRLMKMSDSLARQTADMIRSFDSHPGRPALFSYSGTSFKALAPWTLDQTGVEYASGRLSILSGMYGIVDPLDRISPYRLEMKTALSVEGKKNLTSLWRNCLTGYLNERLDRSEDKTVINLASGEYARVLLQKEMKGHMITFHFKEKSPSGYRTVGMHAKTARGLMLRRILSDKVDSAEDLKINPPSGYEYRKDLSDGENWVFVRG